jgi:hypothetical protein
LRAAPGILSQSPDRFRVQEWRRLQEVNLALNGGHVEFDFGADGSAEGAILNMTMVRH